MPVKFSQDEEMETEKCLLLCDLNLGQQFESMTFNMVFIGLLYPSCPVEIRATLDCSVTPRVKGEPKNSLLHLST